MTKVEYIRNLSYGDVKCNVCKKNCTPCMINNKLWKIVSHDLKPNLKYKKLSNECKFLCLLCVESILNRPLNESDFKDYKEAPINNGAGGFDYKIFLSLK